MNNTLTLTVIVSGTPFTMTSISRRPSESNWSMISRGLQNVTTFVTTNELGDIDSVERAWST